MCAVARRALAFVAKRARIPLLKSPCVLKMIVLEQFFWCEIPETDVESETCEVENSP